MSVFYFCPVCDRGELAWPPCDHAKIAAPVTLLPCPFCSGPPAPFHCVKPIVRAPWLRLLAAIRLKGPEFRGFTVEAYVFCHECGAQSRSAEDFIDSRAEAPSVLPGLMERAVLLWQTRNQRHARLYEACAEDGLNLYPRAER